MTFTDDEIRALATFLARRLTPDLKPTDPMDAPTYGDTPFDQWERTLKRARATGRVAGLFRAAARALPGDPALLEASALIQANADTERVRAGSVLALASAALLLIAFGGVVTSLAMAAFGGIAPHAAPVPTSEVAVVASAADLDRPLVETSSVSPPAPRVEDGPPEGPLADLATPSPGRSTSGPCATDGWFYAGTVRPVERYVATHAMFVRAEPPSKENGWNSRAPVKCWLGKGDIVRLADAPLELPGHHYWIHLDPHDVTRPLDVAMR